jgi:hypothetical protein
VATKRSAVDGLGWTPEGRIVFYSDRTGGAGIWTIAAGELVDARPHGYGLTVAARNPSIYAIDWNAGYGNDWQWVHFRERLLDNYTGVTVKTNGWSQWSAAYDNRAAAYTGEQSIGVTRPSPASRYRLVLDVEWWTQTDRLLALTYRVNRYNTSVYLNGIGWAPSGIQTYCYPRPPGRSIRGTIVGPG